VIARSPALLYANEAMDTDFLFSLAVLAVLGAAVLIAIWRTQKKRIAQEQRERDEREAARADKRPPPSPDGKFTAFDLWPQAKYRIVAAFVDYDNVTHEVGERWTFLRKAFLPYESGLSLFVEENGREIHIRMQCRDDAQGHIVNSFSDYVVEE
jgi:hypothetical protein